MIARNLSLRSQNFFIVWIDVFEYFFRQMKNMLIVIFFITANHGYTQEGTRTGTYLLTSWWNKNSTSCVCRCLRNIWGPFFISLSVHPCFPPVYPYTTHYTQKSINNGAGCPFLSYRALLYWWQSYKCQHHRPYIWDKFP